MKPGVVTSALTLWLVVPAAGSALGRAPLPVPGQSTIEAAAEAFRDSWGSGDLEAIARRMDPAGVRLHVGGMSHLALPPRQARAALADFLDRLAPASPTLERASALGGSPPRGVAELRWETVAEGTSEPLVYTIFVSYTRSGESWRIGEIRIL